MPLNNNTIDPSDGSGNYYPYFNLNLSQFTDDLTWVAGQEKPLPAVFSLNLVYMMIQNPYVKFNIYFSQQVTPWLSLQGASVMGVL